MNSHQNNDIARRLRQRKMGELDQLAAREIDRLTAELQLEQQNLPRIAALIHYPQCWDTAAYPSISDALTEVAAWSGCSACKDAQKPVWCGDPYNADCDNPNCTAHPKKVTP